MRIFVILLLSLLASPLFADEVRQWLDRMSVAMKTHNYEGVFVYQHGSELELMRIVHGHDGEHERERLFSLNGEAREVIRDNHSVICIWPNSQSVTVSKSDPRSPFLSTVPDSVGRLDRFYDLLVTEGERVVGRDARLLSIHPKDAFRYGYRLWLDQKSDLLLRSDLLDSEGKIIEVVMFTELTLLDKVPKERFVSISGGKGFIWHHGKESKAPLKFSSPWFIKEVPEGFVLTSQTEKTMSSKGMPIFHTVYSDGLASVSIFIEKLLSEKERFQGMSKMGAVTVYGRVIGDHQITVVGEVPMQTVKLIAQSITPVTPSSDKEPS
ncbi:MAG: MucB/RseB C-terminal domain-containing protein [Gammaproteobacteria bacterium]|nr:MucB/RseB C-terminal domain-containing protein [Gammaproteobacteria bacterium]